MAQLSAHDLDFRCINAVRGLCVDAVERAKSGHPGLPLGAAPMAYVLFDRHLRFAPTDPSWPNRDRFVLSAGHGSMLLYALLHVYGYALGMDDLKAFRQLGSRTPGHPEREATVGVEANTGPLGQGAANSVGMALAEAHLAARYNRPGHHVVEHRTWALVSDGDLMEGVAQEAAALAGHWGLGKLTWLYDANAVTLDGPAKLTLSEDVPTRFRAMGWHVVEVADGDHDLDAIDAALQAAKGETARPSLVVVRTTIGYGAPTKQGTHKSHGAPLGPEEAAACRKALGLGALPPFTVPAEVTAHAGRHRAEGRRQVALWQAARAAWSAAYPDLAYDWQLSQGAGLPPELTAALPRPTFDRPISTREVGGQMVQLAAQALPQLIGGDADLASSCLTTIAGGGDFGPGPAAAGRNVRYGVREHGMAAIANGMAYHGGLLPFVGTFFAFSDYMRPALRMAAMAKLPVLWVFTHDSAALGEDGPTHQPIEQLASLRALPEVVVLRPADAHETHAAWACALRLASSPNPRPVALVLSRQKVPLLPAARVRLPDVARGAYVVRPAADDAPEALLLATGAEVHLAIAAAERLEAAGTPTQVVSMVSWELFMAQSEAYRDQVLPPSLAVRASVEAASTLGWHRWLGSCGQAVGIDRFGISAPGPQALEALGITEDAVVAAVHKSQRAAGRTPPPGDGARAPRPAEADADAAGKTAGKALTAAVASGAPTDAAAGAPKLPRTDDATTGAPAAARQATDRTAVASTALAAAPQHNAVRPAAAHPSAAPASRQTPSPEAKRQDPAPQPHGAAQPGPRNQAQPDASLGPSAQQSRGAPAKNAQQTGAAPSPRVSGRIVPQTVGEPTQRGGEARAPQASPAAPTQPMLRTMGATEARAATEVSSPAKTGVQEQAPPTAGPTSMVCEAASAAVKKMPEQPAVGTPTGLTLRPEQRPPVGATPRNGLRPDGAKPALQHAKGTLPAPFVAAAHDALPGDAAPTRHAGADASTTQN